MAEGVFKVFQQGSVEITTDILKDKYKALQEGLSLTKEQKSVYNLS